jgi:hypothetical protein
MKIIFLSMLFFSSMAAYCDGESWSDVQAYCHERFNRIAKEAGPFPTDVVERRGFRFVSTARVLATQPRFTFIKIKKTLEKRNKLERKRGAILSPLTRNYEFTFNNGNALYDKPNALKVVAYRGMLYDVDGHHRDLSSIMTEATTVPVYVVESFPREMTPAQFRERMLDPESPYAYDLNGDLKHGAYHPCDMEDDPNLYLARLITLKVKYDFADEKNLDTEDLQREMGRVRYPLVIKINGGKPFQEFAIADLARKNGIVYRESWGDVIPEDILEKLDAILEEAAFTQNHPRMIILESIKHVSDLNVDKLIRKHTEKIWKQARKASDDSCARVLLQQ